ncbi:MAG: bifunctional methylenetetrahydrofolate dehydrogenase/methenyltetrahydrofolate cyclohydrolase, partial [Novosphingobium sp. 17-62-8]
MAQIIDGKALAAQVLARTAADVAEMVAAGAPAPGLAVILVGNDPASEVYVGRKIAQCRKAGISSIEHRLPADTPQGDVLALIDTLNADAGVHGILVQLPLPKHIDAALVLDR